MYARFKLIPPVSHLLRNNGHPSILTRRRCGLWAGRVSKYDAAADFLVLSDSVRLQEIAENRIFTQPM